MMKKKSITARLLIGIFILIGFILIGIGVPFNILINEYIDTNAHEQLDSLTQIVENLKESDEGQPNQSDEPDLMSFLRDIRRIQEKELKPSVQSDAKIMLINDSYQMIYPNSNDYFFDNINTYEDVLETMNLYQNDLKSEGNVKIESNGHYYYLSLIPLEQIHDSNESYELVLFLDITNTLLLVNQVNSLLAIVMGAAGLFAVFISVLLARRLARPIRELSQFASRIGRGDFRTCELNFDERELDELASVMNKSAQYLDQYDREQKIFFQNVSHELRTPLMSIKGYAEAIKYDVIEKEMACEIILEEGERLGDLVEELLYISKMDNITATCEASERDLREILSSCVIRQRPHAMKKGIEFNLDFSDQPILIACDEKSMYRAFSNIIQNAIRYANHQITVSCQIKQNQYVITIENDGEQIEEQDLPQIFDRFYKGKGGKNGIGLSIVKTVITKHQGDVVAINTEVGVKFIVTFPVMK